MTRSGGLCTPVVGKKQLGLRVIFGSLYACVKPSFVLLLVLECVCSPSIDSSSPSDLLASFVSCFISFDYYQCACHPTTCTRSVVLIIFLFIVFFVFIFWSCLCCRVLGPGTLAFHLLDP